MAHSEDPISTTTKATKLPLPEPESFSFPYATPYPIQTELMYLVYRAIEDEKIAIVQSPTGTGKSLSLLCSTLTWLVDDRRRTTLATLADYKAQLEEGADPTDPPWVNEHMFERKRRELEDGAREMDERLAEVRRLEQTRREERRLDPGGSRHERKRLRPDPRSTAATEEEDEESAFLPHDVAGSSLPDSETDNISPAVRALMAQLNPTLSGHPPPIPLATTQTKLFLTSRTHSQLSQLLAELRKTTFATSTRAVALGSRRTLCINEKVRAPGEAGLDERCLDLQSSKGGDKKRCEFLPGKDEGGVEGSERGRAFGERVLAELQDIEDLVGLGKEVKCCPYYGTRSVIPQAELVTLPYNLVLQKSAREALGIDLTGQILVIDEAHNLIDTLLSIHSQTITLPSLTLARAQLKTYLLRFKHRFAGRNALYLKQTLLVLNGLVELCERWAADAATHGQGKGKAGETKGDMLMVGEVVRGMGKAIDQINLLEVVRYLKDSRIAVKVSGYAEKLIMDDEAAKLRQPQQQSRSTTSTSGSTSMSTSTRHASVASMHQLEAFLLSLANADADGRVLLSSTPSSSSSSPTSATTTVQLKYLLLNPTDHFSSVVSSVRSLVLAGGTMEPVSDFHLQLFPGLPESKFANFSCGHVIPKENLATLVVPKGPSGRALEFTYEKLKGDDGLLDELGTLLANMSNLVPDGLVVFFPSYALLERTKKRWTESGMLTRLAAKKKMFYEPQAGNSVEAVLRDYALAVHSADPSDKKTPGSGGALLLAVVGAKLSEGINFADRLARAVVMVGLPFPNLTSPELRERMSYVTELAMSQGLPGGGRAGKELYMNLCMKAVNQSIGRAIRHAADYAVLILADARYAQPSIQRKLPGWIGENVKTCSDQGGFGEAARGVAGFFRGRRRG